MMRTRRSAAAFAALATAAAGMFAVSGALAGSASAATAWHGPSYLGLLHHVRTVGSTVPFNGDVNPYGVAVVPRSTGRLHRGDVLVSNFNNRFNIQGTGTTIVQVHTGHHGRGAFLGHGHASVFAHVRDRFCPGGVGLTSALVTLHSGWTIVGSLPTRRGHISGPGCLIVLDRWGHVWETIRGDGIAGPWGMTALEIGGRRAAALGGRGGRGIAELFITNVLGGFLGHHHGHGRFNLGGTVLRLIITDDSHQVPRVIGARQIGSRFPVLLSRSALVIGPTGVGLGSGGTLYVADTLANRIAGIPNAIFRLSDDRNGHTVSRGHWLRGPLGLAIAPNGHIITANGGDGNLVETTPHGRQVAVVTVLRHGRGDLFGIAIRPGRPGVYFVDDSIFANNLKLLF